jgi:tripartite-type tricarboxylate transporter receptor subunit TctC
MSRYPNATCLYLLVVLAACAAAQARAAESTYPNRPIRFICPYPPGGSTDPTSRLFGAWLSDKLGQTVVVDNRPGAGATIGHGLAAHATPDGYTLLLGTSGGLVVGPAYGTKVSYDPVKDFTPIGLVVDAPFVLIVHPGVQAKTVKELIDLAKAQPGKILFGSPGAGTPNHLGMELLKSMAGAQFVHVAYKGGGPALVDLLSGRIHALFGSLPYTNPAIRSGKAKPIAVGHPTRVRLVPDLPAIAEVLPGFNNTTWYGILAPAGMPRPIVDKLNAEIRKAVADPTFRERLETMGLDPISSTPEALHERIRSELARWTKVIKDTGIGLKQ